MLRRFSLLIGIVSVTVSLVSQTAAQETPAPLEPTIVEASDDGQTALQGFRLSDGITGSLFAAEPLVANPVVFYVDSKSRVFVCESFRQEKGVTDNRGHSQEWVDADLASQTVADRRKYHEEQLGDDVAKYNEQDDRIRLLLDTDDDGVADAAHVFADGFNDLVEGTGAGVLELNGDVYYACIPNLWRMRDHDGDLKADSREALHTGYGVRVAFRGHDMHGLRLGPDGRIYYSIGDRGANVETPNGRVKNTHSGSVFRCDPDGSNLELFATGLRNPQELAFDDFGNLFTGDNNSDSGDRARWVYVVEGGDTGWRMAYQYLRDRGPFNRERIWEPFHEGQPAYIIPPVANFADGPSGLDYYPGTGFSDEFNGRFVMADFRGTPSRSGIRSFRVERDGAFFTLADDDQESIWSLLATDVQFGPDGSLYVSDWVNGWNGEGKGRIYRFVSPEHQKDPVVAEVKTLLAESLVSKKTDELVAFLSHADQRVRLKAQFELASRGAAAALAKTAESTESLFARLHAMWGLEQVARADASDVTAAANSFRILIDDADAEVRAHSARLLGELDQSDDRLTIRALRKSMSDENSRVRYFASLSIGKLKASEAFVDVVGLLDVNDNMDPILRHGGVMALSQIAPDDELEELKTHKSVAVRLAAVIALRRQESTKVAAFLQDESESVVLEAARAIHDVPIAGAMANLAAIAPKEDTDEQLLRRVLNANFRLGDTKHAQAIVKLAANKDGSAAMRLEAIEMLGDWKSPNSRDRVLGMWRPIQDRDAENVIAALRPVIGEMADSDSALRLAAARVGADLGIAEAAPILLSLIADDSMRANERADALRSLAKMTGKESLSAVRDAVNDEATEVRAAGLELMATLDPAGAAPLLEKAAMEGEQLERQKAIAALGQIGSAESDKSIAKLLDQLVNDKLAPEVHLETLTAARGRDSADIKSLVAAYDAKLDPNVRIDQFRETLHGGDATRGRQIFSEKTSVGCVRCHKVFVRGGEVGPELSRIAAEKSREYLLEAIVDPNKTIAKGFESVMIVDEDGQSHVGVLKEETDTELTIMDANAKSITIPKAAIELRKPSQSAMPEDVIKQLTNAELRDLVEYLSSLDGSRRRRGFGRRRTQ